MCLTQGGVTSEEGRKRTDVLTLGESHVTPSACSVLASVELRNWMNSVIPT